MQEKLFQKKNIIMTKKNKYKTFKEVYSFPFELEKVSGWVFDRNREHAFEFSDSLRTIHQKIYLSIINGEEKIKLPTSFTYDASRQTVFNKQGHPVISIRGYGYLTGVGGLRLSHEEANHIQDSLGNYIVEKLNGKK